MINFALICGSVIFVDLLLWIFYDFRSNIINFFIVLIAALCHPFYFILSYLSAFALCSATHIINTTQTHYFLIIIALFMILFFALRYKILKSILNKIFNNNFGLLKISKFYFFTAILIPIYFVDDLEGLTYAVYTLLPILVFYMLIYSVIKILLAKFVFRKYKTPSNKTNASHLSA